jgi:iron-sulfur cluster repair protein YtfE (RIC family)
MKRDKNLETLSWEHHDGLVLAFRLEKGIKNNVDLSIISNYLLHNWDHGLRHHFWQEEQSLQIPLRKIIKGRDFLKQMLEEHDQLKHLIEMIRSNGKDMKSTIEKFYNNLNHHIRFEERKLFPLVEELASTKALAKIGVFLHEQHKPGKKEWQPEFWRG